MIMMMMMMRKLITRPDLHVLVVGLIHLLIWLFVTRVEAVVVTEHMC